MMKKHFLLQVLALFGAVFSTSFAAEEGKPAEAPAPASEAQKIVDLRLKMMKERLNLTPEQAEKIGAILLRDQEKFIQLRDDKGLTRAERNAKAREILKASTVELQALLTPEQKELWAAEAEKQRKAMQEKRAAAQAAQGTQDAKPEEKK